jgi:dephospho-CoA kinase
MLRQNPFRKIKNPIIALTGGIASGKTTAAYELKKLGAEIIDCDALSRQACGKGSIVLKKIMRCFGRGILKKDGSLNRRKLGITVFSDKAERRKLESIIHPYILNKAVKIIKNLKSGRLAVLDAPLLFETGLDRFVDKVIVVWAPRKIQIRRLNSRNNLSPCEISMRIASQMPLSVKKKKADYVIDNSGKPSLAKNNVKKIWEVLTKEYR